MLKYNKTNMIEVDDWDNFISDTYKKPYSFQQQEGCKSRGTFSFNVPSDYTDDDEMNDEIPIEINGEIMGVIGRLIYFGLEIFILIFIH